MAMVNKPRKVIAARSLTNEDVLVIANSHFTYSIQKQDTAWITAIAGGTQV
jgi:hypothetical protein